MWALASPKNNKSVLKSAMGSAMVKKKVLFDLEKVDKEKNSEKEAAETKSIEEFLLEEEYKDKKEANDSDWNTTSSILEEKLKSPMKEMRTSSENIQLKTSQSERIAEISKKIQEKLESSRRKPAGSVEAMFSPQTQSDEPTFAAQMTSDGINSMMDHHNQVPRPAPRKQLLETKDSDLDIDELLATIRQKRNQKLI
ncbi:uncharacterized protein LOC111642941 [Copidosoma floridanum]|nr:uncharacterized protein LOC111642941 [Copidosoma floridanum]